MDAFGMPLLLIKIIDMARHTVGLQDEHGLKVLPFVDEHRRLCGAGSSSSMALLPGLNRSIFPLGNSSNVSPNFKKIIIIMDSSL